MSEYDYVFVGGGINALVAAAMLGKKRRTTLVLERNSAIGGCLRTEEVTAPGFLHDVMATTLVLFRTSPAYQALGPRTSKRAALPSPIQTCQPRCFGRTDRASFCRWIARAT